MQEILDQGSIIILSTQTIVPVSWRLKFHVHSYSILYDETLEAISPWVVHLLAVYIHACIIKMTKFVSDSLAARSGRSRGFTAKDRRKELEQFQATGILPSTSGLDEGSLPQVPESRHSRTHIFFDYSISSKHVGRVVVELFEDLVPSPASLFCSCVTQGDFQHTRVDKILRGVAIFGGKTSNKVAMKIKEESTLRHVDGGLVSISRNGNGYAICMSRALHLDATHQVVGKVTKGLDVLDTICSFMTKADDSPVQMIQIENCGTTDYKGIVEFSGLSKRQEKKDSSQVLDEVRKDLHCAIHVGLKRNNPDSETARQRKKILAFEESSSSTSSESQ